MVTFAEYSAYHRISVTPLEDIGSASIIEILAKFYESNKQKMDVGRKDGYPLVIDVYLIHDSGFNAFAGSFDDADVIGVHEKSFDLLTTTARGLVSQGLILPDVKSPDINVKPISINFKIADLQYDPGLVELRPLADPKREKIAMGIYEASALFLLCHEFTHIYNGHADWTEKLTGRPLFLEIDSQRNEPIAGFGDETVEWDADLAAVQSCLGRMLGVQVKEVEGRAVWIIPEMNSFGTIRDAIEIVLIGAFVCCLYFAVGDPTSPGDAIPRCHPHPLFRFILAGEQVAHVLRYRTGASMPELDRILPEIVNTMLSSWVGLFGKDSFSDFEAIGDPNFTNWYTARADIWTATWTKIHPELDKLKRGGRLAPALTEKHPAFPDVEYNG